MGNWITGRNLAHEKVAERAVRARRARDGKPPAGWVMDQYWQGRRIYRHVKENTK